MNEMPSAAETAAYYEQFSFETGREDWRRDNGRHLRISQELSRLLGAARDLRILDVGCGAGVLASELCRYGQVTGVDISVPALELAAELEPRATFLAGSLQELDFGTEFDLVTLFDVVEHVPANERQDLFRQLDAVLSSRGWLLLTTPHPAYTRWLRRHEPHLLQIVDEPVAPEEVVALASAHGLDLVDYRAYDVDRLGSRQYQLLAFARPVDDAILLPAGGRLRRLVAQMGALPVRPVPQARRLAHALLLVRAGRTEAAQWLLGRRDSPPGQSDR